MRIALLADLHGNTVALDAVLAAVGEVDVLLFLGDLAAGGPDPAGAVARVAGLDAVSVRGNTDEDLVEPPAWWADPVAAGVSEGAQRLAAVCTWGAQQLAEEHERYLASLPATAEVPLGDAGRLLAFHGSPTGLRDVLLPTTPQEELVAVLGGAGQEVLVGGHTHVPMLRQHLEQTLINPGSVGAPFCEYGSSGDVAVAAYAAYAVLEVSGTDWNVEFRRAAVDTNRLRDHALHSGMPHADWWLALRGL